MKIAERLKVIPLIAAELGKESMSIINLTLEQFGLSVTNRITRKSPVEYIISRIRLAPDETLQELAKHLGLSVDFVGAPREATFWKEGHVKLFISHLARKKETATELREELDRVGISGFVAHNDIAPSKEWQNEIEAALQTCDAVVALMVEGFHQSFWTDQEIGFAFGRGLPVIPVNMGENPYGFIAKIQAYKFRDVPALSETIFKVLLTDARTSRKMSEALVSQFIRSKSFAAATQNLRLLKKIKHWDDPLIEMVKSAPKKNDQIRGAFDVPEGVNALVKKLRSKKALISH